MPINLSWILPVFVLIFVVIGALNGFRRGVSRQVIRLCLIAGSIILSFWLTGIALDKFLQTFDSMTSEQMYNYLLKIPFFANGPDISWIKNLEVGVVKALVAVPTALIISPVVFIVLFEVFRIVSLILHVVLCGILGFSKRRNNIFTRLLGMCVGALTGVVIAGVFMLPVVGLGNAYSYTVTTLSQEKPEEPITSQLTQYYNTYAKPLVDSPAYKFYNKIGLGAIYKNMTTVNIDGTETDATTVLPDCVLIYSEGGKLKDTDFKKLNDSDKESMLKIIDIISQNPTLLNISSGLVRSLSNAIANGGFNIQVEEPLKEVVNDGFSIFTDMKNEHFSEDMKIILYTYFILSDDNVILAFDKDTDAVLNALTVKDANGITTVNRIIENLRKSERTAKLVSSVSKISVIVMSQQLGVPNSENLYNSVKEGLKGTLQINKADYASQEEYLAAVSASIDSTLKANSIELEQGIIDNMAIYVNDNFSDKEEITDADADELILSYYDAYLKSQENPGESGGEDVTEQPTDTEEPDGTEDTGNSDNSSDTEEA